MKHSSPPIDEADFLGRVLAAYADGTADRDLPASADVARSLIPGGTARARDFSGLSPNIPALDMSRCVGCMACVSVCPDAALMAVALPGSEVEAAIALVSGSDAEATVATELYRHFAVTQKYAEVPKRRGIQPALFGLFVDATRCKGCAECVEVCSDLGHDAIAMLAKAEDGRDPTPTLDRYAQAMELYRALPPTPPEYRNEKGLADLMLGEHAYGYIGGAGSCAGCGEGTAIRMLIAATRQAHGPASMGIVAATGCNTVFGSTYPYNPYLVPWTNSLFENAPADALGIRLRWDQAGHQDRRLWVIGGDGAMYDIGFQSLSRMAASGADIKVLVLDGQVYSNTGGQSSTASFGGQVTKLSAFGAAIHGRPERRKELGRILIGHGEVYVAQTTPAHTNHFYRTIMEANEYPGPAIVIAYTACPPEHGIADDAANHQAKLAVDSRAFPLFTYDPRRGATLAERLSLQGNPSQRENWAKDPSGQPIDFLTFARSEARFAPHFRGDGSATPEIHATNDERLANWRTLQEMAGVI